ncbi:MAG: cytidylate kinase-like family protein [Acidobacteriia bacterium]|nr:cytidylate kinase-like family protein [Terriglobia bacterium]
MIRVITIAREYGSGGGPIAQILARRLGWKLIDDALVARIAESARTSPAAIRSREERVDPWFHHLTRALWRGGFEGALSRPIAEAVDSDTVARLWHRVIEEAAAAGECVTVGRGGQCLLQKRPDAFHAYVYGPMAERVRRLQPVEPPGTDLRAAAIDRDRCRAAYIRHYFGADWRDPHLYNLMLCSSMGLERAADVILTAAGLVTVA